MSADGGDFVTWNWVKDPICPNCKHLLGSPGCDTRFVMDMEGNHSYCSETFTGVWKCRNCSTKVVISHTFSIDSVEVTE